MKENQPVNIEEIIEKQYYQETDEEKISYDAWGRQIDD